MPAKSEKQANAAKLALAVKAGKVPSEKVGKSIKAMSKMTDTQLKHFTKLKELVPSMTLEQKTRFLHVLKLIKEETGVSPVDASLLDEESIPNKVMSSKTTESGNWESITNQNRGIECSDKDKMAVSNYKNNSPINDINKKPLYFLNYEITDGFGNNSEVIIKKHIDPHNSTKYRWVAYIRNTASKSDAGNNSGDDNIITDNVQIINSITFDDDVDGAGILNKFLGELNI